MPSIAQVMLDKFNGVTPPAQGPLGQATAVRHKTTSHVNHLPLSEEQLRAKELIRNALRKGVWMIDYTKVDGTAATLECTLDPAFMPDQTAGVAGTGKQIQEHLLAVYAVDRQGWRSFVVNNVKKIYKKVENL